jgi:hypothetical protein
MKPRPSVHIHLLVKRPPTRRHLLLLGPFNLRLGILENCTERYDGVRWGSGSREGTGGKGREWFERYGMGRYVRGAEE